MRETYRSKLPTHSFFTPRILPSLRQLSLFPGEFSDQLRCPISRISDLYSIAPQLHHLSLPDWHEANMTPLLLKCENLISFETKGNHRISTTHHGKPLIGLRIKRDYQSPREPILAVVKSAFLIGLFSSRLWRVVNYIPSSFTMSSSSNSSRRSRNQTIGGDGNR